MPPRQQLNPGERPANRVRVSLAQAVSRLFNPRGRQARETLSSSIIRAPEVAPTQAQASSAFFAQSRGFAVHGGTFQSHSGPNISVTVNTGGQELQGRNNGEGTEPQQSLVTVGRSEHFQGSADNSMVMVIDVRMSHT